MKLAEIIRDAKKIAIAGHVRPDGDCVGAALGIYDYITDNYKDVEVHVYLEQPSPKLSYLANYGKIETEVKDTDFDLFIAVDLGDPERMGVAYEMFTKMENTVNIDHHLTNYKYAKINHVFPEVGSCCEVIYDMMEDSKISKDTAEAIYTGIVHDTGVFKYSNTTRQTMEIAGRLIEKGARSQLVIDGTFYQKTFKQNKMLAKALDAAFLMFDGKVIVSCLEKDVFDEQNATNLDTDGVVDALRITEGVECALWMYEYPKKGTFKCSLRSNEIVNVSMIAGSLGGGGHVRAAGCEVEGDKDTIILKVTDMIKAQLDHAEAE